MRPSVCRCKLRMHTRNTSTGMERLLREGHMVSDLPTLVSSFCAIGALAEALWAPGDCTAS